MLELIKLIWHHNAMALHTVTRPSAKEKSVYEWTYPPKPLKDKVIKVRLQNNGETLATVHVPLHIMKRFKVLTQIVYDDWYNKIVIFAHEVRYNDIDLETRVYISAKNIKTAKPIHVFGRYELVSLDYPRIQLQHTEYPNDIDFAQELWPVGDPVWYTI